MSARAWARILTRPRASTRGGNPARKSARTWPPSGDLLTSSERTFATYGRETFIRFASAVCESSRNFIRRINFLRNAELILSIAFMAHSVTDLLRGVKGTRKTASRDLTA